MVQASPASIGLVVSSMSFPYKQSPAYNRNESLAPSPAGRTIPDFESRIASVTSRVFAEGIEISTPSSPVYLTYVIKFLLKLKTCISSLKIEPTQNIE